MSKTETTKQITKFISSDDSSKVLVELNILMEYQLGDRININQKEYEVVDNSYLDEISFWHESQQAHRAYAHETPRIEAIKKSAIVRTYSVYKIPEK